MLEYIDMVDSFIFDFVGFPEGLLKELNGLPSKKTKRHGRRFGPEFEIL
jgi:hypothetical protein